MYIRTIETGHVVQIEAVISCKAGKITVLDRSPSIAVAHFDTTLIFHFIRHIKPSNFHEFRQRRRRTRGAAENMSNAIRAKKLKRAAIIRPRVNQSHHCLESDDITSRVFANSSKQMCFDRVGR